MPDEVLNLQCIDIIINIANDIFAVEPIGCKLCKNSENFMSANISTLTSYSMSASLQNTYIIIAVYICTIPSVL